VRCHGSVASHRGAVLSSMLLHSMLVLCKSLNILECQCEHPTIFSLSQPLPDKTLLTSPTRADLSLAGRSNKEPVDHRLHKGACLPRTP